MIYLDALVVPFYHLFSTELIRFLGEELTISMLMSEISMLMSEHCLIFLIDIIDNIS